MLLLSIDIRSHPDRLLNPDDEANDCDLDGKPALLDDAEETDNNNNSLHYNVSEEFKGNNNNNSVYHDDGPEPLDQTILKKYIR